MQIIERLSVSAPPAETRLKVLKEIAQEFSFVWDSSNTEAELWKMHEDLLVAVNLVMLVAHSKTSFFNTTLTILKRMPSTRKP